jgi:hypothetical protein
MVVRSTFWSESLHLVDMGVESRILELFFKSGCGVDYDGLMVSVDWLLWTRLWFFAFIERWESLAQVTNGHQDFKINCLTRNYFELIFKVTNIIRFHLNLIFGSYLHQGIALNYTIHGIRIIMYALFSSWLDWVELLLGWMTQCTKEASCHVSKNILCVKFTGSINWIFV